MVALQDALQMYHESMEEVKLRLATISSLVQGIDQSEHPHFDAEYAYLHLRLSCELIALGSLMVHDPGNFRKLNGSYKADEITTLITKTKPTSFPRAVKFERNEVPTTTFDWEPSRDVQQSDFRTIYTSCGKVLHRHTIKEVLKRRNKVYDVAALRSHNLRLSTWLSQHAIEVDGMNDVMLVDMFGGPENGVRIARGNVNTLKA